MIQKGSIRAQGCSAAWRSSAIVVGGLLAAAARPRAPAAAARRRHVHDRLRQRRRRRQRLARGVDLLGQGPGGRVGPGRRASPSSTTTRTRPASSTDIRDLIAEDVNAIIINPNDPDALNPAHRGGHRGRASPSSRSTPPSPPPAPTTCPTTRSKYAYLGAKWLFEQLGGKGAVVYMRGIAGHPADTDRDTGFKKALAEYPDITVAKEVVDQVGSSRPAVEPDQRHHRAAACTFDGIWTSGIDSSIVDAHEDRQASARADRRRGQRRLRRASS